MLRCRKKKCVCCSCCACLLLMLIGPSYFMFLTYPNSQPCSMQHSQNILNQMCDDYENNEVVGNLCADICHYKNVTFVTCMNHYGGKIVFLMSYRGQDAVLKFDDTNIPVLSSSPSIKSFKKNAVIDIRDLLTDDITGDDDEVLRQIAAPGLYDLLQNGRDKAGQNEDTDSPTPVQRAAMRSLWELIYQDEYMLFSYLNGHNVLPTLYGSCGGLYMVEYADPGRLDGSFLDYLFVTKADWRKRVNIALKLLEFMSTIDTVLPEHIHFCDVTVANFGMVSDGTIKAIDVDTAFLDSKLSQRLRSDSVGQPANCTKHMQCGFGDCLGWCNIETGKCHGRRSNNNLQEVCEDLFSGHTTNGYTGLLHSPPSAVAPALEELLAQCSQPPPPDDASLPGCVNTQVDKVSCPNPGDSPIRYASGPKIIRSLERVLKDSIRD